MTDSLSAFDRYASLTDLEALKGASARPLRKSVRVNTLKCSVEDFRAWAEEKGWTLTPVPWCAEASFIDRENRETALGRDLRHLLGHFYMQEAASMLPPALLDPKPGEVILDLCAAPGSKTTQIAARLVCASPPTSPSLLHVTSIPQPLSPEEKGECLIVEQSQTHTFPSSSGGGDRGGGLEQRRTERGDRGGEAGLVIANDVQEKRLWVLNDAVQRTGAANVVIVRKVGQWYAKHMTERFDRVLCDAPCTAQGTARKDSDALNFCSEDSIAKMARLQVELLESAIHAAKVGGRIVYSTCTLTPEENESVVLNILNKYSDQLEVVHPKEALTSGLNWDMRAAISDSEIVQKSLNPHLNPSPFLRLWPQTYDTEGFFCAVLHKIKPTRAPEKVEMIRRHVGELSKSNSQALKKFCSEVYGTTFLLPGECLIERGQQVLLATVDAVEFPLPVTEYAFGIPFAKILTEGRFRIANDLASLRGHLATRSIIDLSDSQLSDLLSGHDSSCDPHLRGDMVLRSRGISIGVSLAKDGVLMNRLPRWVVKLGGKR
ncbi:MAG: hypothetical protein V1876_00415 [Candidatus Peregrinibacteria bacterium]